jgi:DNA-binding GntR family transcriptional regulator
MKLRKPRDPAQVGEPYSSPKSFTLIVYEAIRGEILRCELLPGSKLKIADIAERFDVSNAAVREALSRLVVSDMVEAIDQRGFRVTDLSLADMVDLTETRIEIEALCLRKAIALGDQTWEQNIVEAFDNLRGSAPDTRPYGIRDVSSDRVPNLLGRHEIFHKALVAACDSRRLRAMQERLSEQSQRYRLLSRKYEKIPRDVDKEHQDIVNAVLRRDADQAVQLMTAHLRKTMDNILRAQGDMFKLIPFSG